MAKNITMRDIRRRLAKFGWTAEQLDHVEQEQGRYFLFELLLEETWGEGRENPEVKSHEQR